MRKLQLLCLLTIISLTSAFAQEDCAELKTELTKKEAIIAKQQNDISKLEKNINYYKETLDLMNSKISTETKDVTFKINSVSGDSNTGKITIEGILVNNGVLRSIQTWQAKVFDPQGNGVSTFKMTVGNDIRIPKLFKDIPTKFTVTFEQIIEGTPTIKILMIDFMSTVNYHRKDLSVVFKNLPIEWK